MPMRTNKATLFFYGITLCLIYSKSWAFSCFFTFVKDSCWKSYDVTVTVTDPNTEKNILTLTVPKNTAWGRVAFDCEPNEKMFYNATFSPTFWEGTEGHVYRAKQFWMLPKAPNPGETAWEVKVCYPRDFAEVPFPPTAMNGNCKCDFNSIPPIPPKINK